MVQGSFLLFIYMNDESVESINSKKLQESIDKILIIVYYVFVAKQSIEIGYSDI